IWVLWPMAFIVGSNHAFYFPASTALLQEILPPEEYMNANALREVTFQVGSLSAAGIAGWIVDTYGLSGVLWFDASTYIFSAFCISRVRAGRVAHPERDQGETYWGTIRSGLNYLWSNKPIFIFGIMSMVPFVAIMALNVLMPTFVKNVLNQGAVTYGLLDMVYGIGAFLGAALVGALVVERHHQSALRLFLLMSALGYLACAFTSLLPVAFVLIGLIGVFNSSFRVVSQTYLMRIIPGKLMGRCTSTFFQISLVAQLSVIFGVGYISEHVTISAGFYLLSALLLGAMIHLWLLNRRLPDTVVKST
ncbi:MAG: MFS transporter, partial [candidate division Zixibacteria bacterium]|nr:MFS transporter [candidate division Zixibacteria bacterium]